VQGRRRLADRPWPPQHDRTSGFQVPLDQGVE